MRLALDKLSGVKTDLVKLDDNQQERGFPHLVNSVRKNKKNILSLEKQGFKKQKIFQTKNKIETSVHVFTRKNQFMKLVSAKQQILWYIAG